MEESPSPPGPSSHPLVGRRIGSYLVLDAIGSGGMSTVFKARHVDTGLIVALKVLSGSLARSSTLLQRFLREARSAETLEHGNIATIYDRGVDQGRHYLVLEYVGGGDFHDYVQRNGPLGVQETLTVIRGVCGGLRYAARRGLIHRDIKPSNILRTSNGQPKIIDLGLALQSQVEDERVTREGTTVGTVDYMAPEQARDSRATSIQSDMYSLGCTFYYLLAGVPPFPGGDITEKLTRHARTPAPEIRDLRPEIPAEISTILRRMMAKQPEDRYADYDQLIEALEAAARPSEPDRGETAVLEAIVDDDPSEDWPTVSRARMPRPDLAPPEDDDAPILLDALRDLASALDEPRPRGGSRSSEARTSPDPAGKGPVAPVVEESAELDPFFDNDEPLDEAIPAAVAEPFPRWIFQTAGVALLAVLFVVGFTAILGGPADRKPSPEPDQTELVPPPAPLVAPRDPAPAAPPIVRPNRAQGSLHHPIPVLPPPWTEPADIERVLGDPQPDPPGIAVHRSHLPDWTRAPTPIPSPDPKVVVRRLPGRTEGTTEPTLHFALDRHRAGVVEVADDGPLPVDDIHMSGEVRVVRARRGFRPIVRILRPRPRPALQRSAYFVLERKHLVLEGLDLVIDARDLVGEQKVFFACSGSQLTIRDCTITVINPTRLPFTLIRQDPSTQPDRPSRILLERTLVRGRSMTAVALTGGPVDLAIDGSAILSAGEAPLFRVRRVAGRSEPRIFLANAILASPGPMIRVDRSGAVTIPAHPLSIRADGSAIGRLAATGIASLITTDDSRTPPDRLVAWSGESNLFAGWKGMLARGPEPNIVDKGPDSARSTWNASDQGSRWIALDWTLSRDPTWLTADELASFLTDRPALASQPSRPSAGLLAKTVGVYTYPIVPEPAPALFAAGPGELVMRTDDPRWRGDLGAFLRDRISPGNRQVRVRVIGSGSHEMTRVRLPDGLTLKLVVEVDPRSGGDPPNWSPAPGSAGPGLIELNEGTLAIQGLELRHDSRARMGGLLSLCESHLILSRCRLIVPPGLSAPAGDLIVFRAPTTRPMPELAAGQAFQFPDDRPVCRLIDTILIGDQAAIRAEIGRGLIALTNCEIASDRIAFALDPGRVARSAFDADLWLDRCTIAAGQSLVELGPWTGLPAGPDRPWLVHSRHSAFFTIHEGKSREGTLLRFSADTFAGDLLFWQAEDDAFDLGRLLATGEGVLPALQRDEIEDQWNKLFWPSNHAIRNVIGPRLIAPKFRQRPVPGRILPTDLALDPGTAGGRGAVLGGIAGEPGPGGPSPRPIPRATAVPHL